MKKSFAYVYLILIHIFLVFVLLKGGFIDRVQNKLGIGSHAAQSSELTDHYHRMLGYHKRMDGNVPDGAVIFIGDSLTQGLCESAVTVPSVNYGIGSDTTFGVLERQGYYRSINRAGPGLTDDTGSLADIYHVGDGVLLNAAGNAVWIDVLKNKIQKVRHSAISGK